MKRATVHSILAIFVIFSSVSCGKSPQPQIQSPQVSEQPKPQKLVIKGFYMGMPFEDAARQAKAVFGEVTTVFSADEALLQRIKQNVPGINTFKGNNDEIDMGANSRFTFDSTTKTVKAIYFYPETVDQAFDASGLNPREFAQKFAAAYQIELESRNGPQGNEWRYVSPNGEFIRISQENKGFSFYQGDVAKLKGNFN